MGTRKYHRLTFNDRIKIEKLSKIGIGTTEISDLIGTTRSTMSRELKRGYDPETKQYCALKAQGVNTDYVK